jgi:penicillin amidase
MKTLFKFVLRFVLVVVVAVLVLGGWLYWRAQASLPVWDGEIAHASLTGEVTVKRDEWGVPHIYAEHEADAYFALGYSQAQDRLFQLELMRRLAQGELSEILGPFIIPEVDAIARSFRLLPKAREHQALHKEKHPEVQALAEAYCAGINHFVDTGELPVEFSILGIPPRHYEPADCMSVAAILPISFSDGMREDSLQGMLEKKFPGKDLFPFFPGYLKEDAPVTVMETIAEAQAFLRGISEPATAPEAAPADAAPAEVPAEEQEARALEGLLAPFSKYASALGFHMGSNSWVVHGSKTASGKPMLANDPHIGFFNPGIWYEAHLKVGTFDLYGYYLPLIPMTLIGHNEHIAWALTMFANDDVDLFVEEFDPNDPSRVKYRGEWTEAKIEEETIKVRFGSDRTTPVRVTPHGPVITDLLRAMLDYEGPDVSLSWVWQHMEYTDLEGFHLMARAKNYEEFSAGVSKITSPGLNISYADAAGNIAWWAAGRIPVRAPHVNPKTLLDGASGNDEILGYVPFEENPHLFNPEEGYIVTANNKSTVKPVGGMPYLQGYWQPHDRAGRIEQMLDERPGGWTLDDMARMQFDDQSYVGIEMAAIIADALDPAGLSPLEAQALEALRSWDAFHGLDSVGASVFWTTNEYIYSGWMGDEAGETGLRIYDTLADSWNAYKYHMRNPDLPGWDDVTTDAVESQQDILRAAFAQAVAKLAEVYGPDPAGWTWGKLHTVTFTHPLGYLPGFAQVFNIGPFPSTGGQHMVNNMIQTGSGAVYKVIAGPSTRRLIDFGDPAAGRAIVPTGNVGHFLSPHYDDQAEMFMKGEYRQTHLTDPDVDANERHRMVFKPE